MAQSGIEVDLANKGFETSLGFSQTSVWSLGCDITIEEVDADIQEIRLADIILTGEIATNEISVDIDEKKANVMDLDVNVTVDGISSSIVESQVVPYDRIIEITDDSKESTNETRYASSALASKKLYDLITSIGIENISGVAISNPKSDNLLLFNGHSWVNVTAKSLFDKYGTGSSSGDSFWYMGDDGKVHIDYDIYVAGNAIITGDTASGGDGSESAVIGATSIVVNGIPYPAVDGVIDLSEAFEGLQVEVDLSDYATKDELLVVNNRLVSLESYFSTSEDADTQINKWNEIVAFLNATEGTTLAGILAAYYTKAEVDSKVTTINNSITALDTKYAPVKTWYDALASLIVKDGNDVRIKTNLIVEGDTASDGEGGGSSVGIQGIVVNGTTYRDTDGDGLIDLGTIVGSTITEITSAMITDALGYTPYDASNPNGYITASALGGYATQSWVEGKGYITASALNAYITESAVNSKLAGYLPLTGGTINGVLTINPTNASGVQDGLILKESGVGHNEALRLKWISTSYTTGNSIYPDSAYENLIYNNGTNAYTLIHSGNIGSQKVAGLATAITIWGQQFDGTGKVSGALTEVTSISLSNYFKISHEDAYQKIQTYGSTPLVINIEGNNVGIGTSAPSYKLHVIGTLGVSGVASLLSNLIVGGNLQMGNEKPIYFKDKDGNNKNGLFISTDNNMWLGYDNGTSIKACIVGSEVRLYYGGVSNIGLLLNSSGNVTIGSSDLAGTAYKMYIDGTVTAGTNSSADRDVRAQNSNGIVSLLASTNRGLYDKSTSRWIAGTNGTNTFLMTGYVGIGTTSPAYKLDVAGTGRFTGAVTMASTLNVGGASTFNGDVRINGNLIVTGDTASGGTGESNVGGNLRVDYNAMWALINKSSITQAEMDAVGFTTEVVENLTIGAYSKIVGELGAYKYVYNYECRDIDGSIELHIYFGDENIDNYERFYFKRSDAGTWTLSFYEV